MMNKLIELLDKVIKDINEPICISLDYNLEDSIKTRFKLYSKKIDKVYLNKQLEEGILDDPYSKSTFMYYLDRFGCKTTIREYYQNNYFISKKRNIK